jgi:hypothetical protein
MQLVKQMARYTTAEYADMHFIYGFCNLNALSPPAAVRERRQPDRRVFQAARRSLRETGSLMPAACDGRGRRDVDDENMLVAAYGKQLVSTASRTGIPQSTVWCVLHENQMHPYHLVCTRATARGQRKSPAVLSLGTA